MKQPEEMLFNKNEKEIKKILKVAGRNAIKTNKKVITKTVMPQKKNWYQQEEMLWNKNEKEMTQKEMTQKKNWYQQKEMLWNKTNKNFKELKQPEEMLFNKNEKEIKKILKVAGRNAIKTNKKVITKTVMPQKTNWYQQEEMQWNKNEKEMTQKEMTQKKNWYQQKEML